MDTAKLLLYCIILIIITEFGKQFFKKFDEYNNKKEKKNTKNGNNIEKIKILLEDNSIEKIDGFINNLINQAIEQYMVLNVNTKEHYINEKESEAIIRYVYATLKINMTQNTKDVIGLIYDVSTDQKLEDLLMLKIKISVLALLVDNNKVIV